MKSKIIVLLSVLLTLFVLVLIWPALQGGSEGYDQKPVNIPTETPVTPVTEPVDSAPVDPEPTPAPVVPEPAEPEPVAPAPIDPAPTPIPVEPESTDPAPISDSAAAASDALYSVVDGNKLDAESYAGFKLYRNWCARCHGTYGQGMVGPNLADSLKLIDRAQFDKTVEEGKQGQIGSMPNWKANVKVMEGLDQLYAYLMARSDGAIGVVKPKKQ